MTPAFELTGVGKRYPGFALDAVDLALFPGRVHALLGENGAGKSTLLAVLAGLVRPDAGAMRLDGAPVAFASPAEAAAAGVVLVHQEVDLFADLSVAENIAFLRGLPSGFGLVDRARVRADARAALAALGADIDADAPGSALTPGRRQLVSLAAALSRPMRVLVLDEPTSSLSAAESESLFTRIRELREARVAVVYVSHRLDEVFALADEVTVLRDGRRVLHAGIADVDAPSLIRAMVGRDVPARPALPAAAAGAVLLSSAALSAADGSFRDVTLAARAGEILGVYGLVGSGRSEWAQAVVGLRGIGSGAFTADGVEYVPEDRLRQGIFPTRSVGFNAVFASLAELSRRFLLWPSLERRRAAGVADAVAVRCGSLDQPVASLSGGNQQKVVLGRWLDRSPKVLILDEPTRGIDVGARDEIHALVRRLADGGTAVVLISSDLAEVMLLADRLAVFRGGTVVGELPGTATAEEIGTLAVGNMARVAAPAVPGRRSPPAAARDVALAAAVAALFVAMHLLTGTFLAAGNLRAIAANTALLAFTALGSMLVLLVGGIDISVGALMALAAAVAGSLWQAGHPFAVVLPAAVAVGLAGGALNAVVSRLGGIHPIVVTLGTMSVYRGLAQWWLVGGDVQIPSASRSWLIDGPGGLTPVVAAALSLSVSLALVLRYTVAGRSFVALGSNPAAAARVGLPTSRLLTAAFAAQGALVGLAAVAALATTGSMQATSYEGVTLASIAAAVVGGTALTGGRASVPAVLVGCVLLAMLGPVCTFLGLPARWQELPVGCVLLAAVTADAWMRRRG